MQDINLYALTSVGSDFCGLQFFALLLLSCNVSSRKLKPYAFLWGKTFVDGCGSMKTVKV